jgi:septum formation protein
MTIPDSDIRSPAAARGPLVDWILRGRPELVLASRSPRRREILERLGIPVRVVAPSLEEVFPDGVAPEEAVRRIAVVKATAAREAGARGLLLAADTAVVVGPRVFGKPRDAADARAMLSTLAGRAHLVVTGIALADEAGTLLSGAESTEVEFRPLAPREIDEYVESGEPLDKAGAYGIQGLGALLVRGIRGDYTNVVGLPVGRLLDLARRLPRRAQAG